jgi:uncharacterized membrane protein YbhN (UPF0104 family)
MKAVDAPLPLVEEPRRHRGLGAAVTLGFFALVLWLLSRLAHRLPWGDVAGVLQAYRAPTLAAAAVLVIASFGLYAAYELLCRRYAGHRLSKRLTAAIGMVAQALNLSLGSWIGGIGGRLRLYTRFGQAPELVARVYGMALLTNWSGYLLLAGIVFSARQMALPEGWRLGEAGLQAIGFALLAAWSLYALACARSPRRSWTLRAVELRLPSLRLAALQALLSALNWMLMAGVVFVLLRAQPAAQGIGYGAVLSCLLLAAVVGVLTHIPGGLGVLEAVFVALLGHHVPPAALVGALLAYRALYYIAPLLLGAVGFVVLEAGARGTLSARRRTPPGPAAR